MVAQLFKGRVLGVYVLSFVAGLIGGLVLPTLSVFMADEIGVRPFLVAMPFAGIAVASIIYNQCIGYWSDRMHDRRPLIASFCCIGAVACLIFAFSRNYWLVLASAVFLFSLSLVSFSQLLAYSREFADNSLNETLVPMFNALVRAQVAVAWVAGPPLGFLMVGYIGFTKMYLLVVVLFLITAGLVYKALPPLLGDQSEASLWRSPRPVAQALSRHGLTMLAFTLVALSLTFGAGHAYNITLPLYLKASMGIEAQWTGWLMGTAAALEIPVMIASGWLAQRFSLVSMIRVGCLSAIVLYFGIWQSTALWQMFALQVFNALFVGICAGLGISLVQDLLPGRAGSASALYTNCIHVGTLTGSGLVAIFAEVYGYKSTYLVNIALITLALVALVMVHPPRHRARAKK